VGFLADEVAFIFMPIDLRKLPNPFPRARLILQTPVHPLQQHGTQMYHPHFDELLQMGMGIMGMFVMGSTRAFEFVADDPGDWAMHCLMTHHIMNQIGRRISNLVDIDETGLDEKT
jgi:hypothetical protein